MKILHKYLAVIEAEVFWEVRSLMNLSKTLLSIPVPHTKLAMGLSECFIIYKDCSESNASDLLCWPIMFVTLKGSILSDAQFVTISTVMFNINGFGFT